MPDRPAFPRGLRVLMLVPSYLPRRGGVEKHVSLVTRELAGLGVEARIAAPRWLDHWADREVIDGVEVSRLSPEARVGRRQLQPLVDWADVVHTHDAYPFLKYYLPYRLRRPRTPVFVTFHGYERYPIPLEAKVLRRLVLWLTRDAICVGDYLPQWYGFRCRNITVGGVDAPAQRPALGQNAVFVGRLEPDTGFMHYLHAVRLLSEEHGLRLPVEVCGDGSLRDEAEKVAGDAGLNVTFHGQVSDVMPYLLGARFAFVTGYLGMLEAMAAGTVVLGVYDNPLKESTLRRFPGASCAVVADSAEALAAQLIRLLRDPNRLEAMAADGYAFARSQSWRAVAELYLRVYEPFLGRGGQA